MISYHASRKKELMFAALEVGGASGIGRPDRQQKELRRTVCHLALAMPAIQIVSG